jgi:hypothetical protein
MIKEFELAKDIFWEYDRKLFRQWMKEIVLKLEVNNYDF